MHKRAQDDTSGMKRFKYKTPKTYAFGQLTDTQRKFEKEAAESHSRWEKAYALGSLPLGPLTQLFLEADPPRSWNLAKNRNCVLVDGKPRIFETCAGECRRVLEITSKNFQIDCTDRPAGLEIVRNGPTYQCRKCAALYSKTNRVGVNEFIRSLLKRPQYKLLTKAWFEERSILQNGRCLIDNSLLVLEKNRMHKASIQNFKTGFEHVPEHCGLICAEFNVPEHKAVSNLVETYKVFFSKFLDELKHPTDTSDLIGRLIVWWQNTPRQNGVTADWGRRENGKQIMNPEFSAQRNKLDLKSIIAATIARHKITDCQSKRDPAMAGVVLSSEQFFDKLISQKGKCFYTGIPFSVARDTWNFWSLERINNKLNHTDANTVLVLRIFNTPPGLSRIRLLEALLSQIHVPISLDDKVIIHAEIQKNAMQKS